MKKIEISNLPSIAFAHEYGAERYRNRFFTHPARIEVCYVVEGELDIIGKNGTYTAHVGDVICMLYDGSVTVSAGGAHVHRTVCARAQWRDSAGGIAIPSIIKADDAQEIRALIDRAVTEQNSYIGSLTREAELVMSLLCAVDRAAGAGERHGEYSYVRKAKHYVATHIRERITQREVAAALGITPGYLCAVFKKAQNDTLMQYINKTKLTAIRGIMQKEHVPLYTAAAMYGYSDPNYVSRLYKKLFSRNITE